MIEPILFGLLVGAAVLMAFVALWQLTGTRNPMEARLERYQAEALAPPTLEDDTLPGRQGPLSGVARLLNNLGLGSRMATELSRADLAVTVNEFMLIRVALGLLGVALGLLRLGLVAGIVVGLVLSFAPVIYVRMMIKKRQQAFTEQLPDVLSLLVSALQAGYGLGQSLQVLVEQLPPPASKEFARVLQGVSLGLPVPRAMEEMVRRVGTSDVDLVVTTIAIQYETGGNLAQTLEVIGETVRDRIRIQKEVRVLTSQQRMTGLVLGGLPIALGFGLYLMNPRHMSKLFAPGGMRFVLIGAVVMQVAGFLAVNRLLQIEV